MKVIKNKTGFTLIEAILSMVLLSVGMVGVLTLFQNNISRSNETEMTMIATYLVQERLERFVHDKLYQGGYDLLVDFTLVEDLTAEGYPGYTRTTTTREVSPGDLTSDPGGGAEEQGYMRVTCVVNTPAGDDITMETLVTDWGG